MNDETSISGALFTFFEDCPILNGHNIDVDFFSKEENTFSIDTIPATSIIKQYTAGGSMRQHLFVLRWLGPHNDDTAQRIENCGLFEHLADWLGAQTNARNLPQLPQGKTAIKIEASAAAYRSGIEKSTVGLYQIQCRLIYVQD